MKTADSFPKMLHGAICIAWKRCGKSNCRCASGQQHGPYHYLMWRENGRLFRHYLPACRVDLARAACDERKRFQGELKDGMERIRSMREQVREAQSNVRSRRK